MSDAKRMGTDRAGTDRAGTDRANAEPTSAQPTLAGEHDATLVTVVPDRSREVLGGLVPRTFPATAQTVRKPLAPAARTGTARRARSAALTAVPVVLTGAIVLGLGLAGPNDAAHARKPAPPKPEQSPQPLGLRAALGQLGAALVPGGMVAQSTRMGERPASHTVVPGDTVSSVAQRFSLSTASVLALNGLSWKSTIFPGQVLALSSTPVKSIGAPAATTQSGRYLIVRGDTISSIAARFGVSTQALLDANHLTWNSIVYPGQVVVVPGRVPAPVAPPAPIVGVTHDAPPPSAPAQTGAPLAETVNAATDSGASNAGLVAGLTVEVATIAASVAAMEIVATPVLAGPPSRPNPGPTAASPPSRPSAPLGAPLGAVAPVAPPAAVPVAPPVAPPTVGPVTPLSAEMRAHAATIIRVGQELQVPEYGIIIALATAMQESSLRNLSWGDRDSVGLFQQRPASGWGTSADLQVPAHAARLFYLGRPGFTRGLLRISGWQNMSLTQAAKAVQISAFPNHYAKWETSARAWYFQLT
jgi:LysM repeat protein